MNGQTAETPRHLWIVGVLAVWAFGVSFVGMALTTVHNFVLTDGAALMGPGAMARRGVLA